MPPAPDDTPAPLCDVRVLELATVIAGPGCARHLADFGADVVKVERPGTGDGVRTMGWVHPDDGETLWWKLVARNKRSVALDLKDPDDRDLVLDLAAEAHVLVENFRPGTLERLGLGPDVLLGRNPDLVVTRVTGFGQDGPYAQRPGFATLAEALGGFAAINGSAGDGPTLPPIALTDEVTGLVAAFATMVALHSGVGQVVDVDLLTSLLGIMGPLPSLAATRGEVLERLGSQIAYSVPRNTYRCADGRWVAVSGTADEVAARILAVVGIGDDPRFATSAGRVAHRAEVDAAVAAWIGARGRDEVLVAFDAADAAVAPVLDFDEIIVDPHLAARGAFVEADGTLQQGPIARLSATPGRVRAPAPALDADGEAIRRERSFGTDRG